MKSRFQTILSFSDETFDSRSLGTSITVFVHAVKHELVGALAGLQEPRHEHGSPNARHRTGKRGRLFGVNLFDLSLTSRRALRQGGHGAQDCRRGDRFQGGGGGGGGNPVASRCGPVSPERRSLEPFRGAKPEEAPHESAHAF